MSPLISVQHLGTTIQDVPQGSGCPAVRLVTRAQLTGDIYHLAPPGQVVRGGQGVGRA